MKKIILATIVASMTWMPLLVTTQEKKAEVEKTESQDSVDLIPGKNEKTGKFGYKNAAGKTIIAFKYEEADAFSNGLAKVKLGGKYGFIDNSGKLVIPCIYKSAYRFYNEFTLAIEETAGTIAIDKEGKDLKLPEGIAATSQAKDDAMIMVLHEGKWKSLVLQDGKLIIQK
jgi:hypothetical protein